MAGLRRRPGTPAPGPSASGARPRRWGARSTAPASTPDGTAGPVAAGTTGASAGRGADAAGPADLPPWAVDDLPRPIPPGATRVLRNRRRRRRWPWVLTALVMLLALSMVLKVPYVIMSPGPAVNTLGNDDRGTPLIAVKGATTYPTTGSLDFTTVTVRGGPGYPVTLFDVGSAWLTPHHEILPVDAVYPPDASADDVKAESTAQMQSSQQAAAVVALRALGRTVPEKVLVAAVPKGSPAEGKLLPDDVVTAIDGKTTPTSSAARAAIRTHRAGDTVRVTVQRKGREVVVPVVAGERDGTVVLGVFLRPVFDLPVDVEISAGDVGGPSAGTMFGLGVYDKLTPGALTGGHRIAGTGALDPDGTVEPIGGIAEKMVAARQAGAEWFLAPRSNCNEVVGNVPDGLRVVSIATFADAVTATKGIGTGATQGLPSCR